MVGNRESRFAGQAIAMMPSEATRDELKRTLLDRVDLVGFASVAALEEIVPAEARPSTVANDMVTFIVFAKKPHAAVARGQGREFVPGCSVLYGRLSHHWFQPCHPTRDVHVDAGVDVDVDVD